MKTAAAKERELNGQRIQELEKRIEDLNRTTSFDRRTDAVLRENASFFANKIEEMERTIKSLMKEVETKNEAIFDLKQKKEMESTWKANENRDRYIERLEHDLQVQSSWNVAKDRRCTRMKCMR